ncbi:16S rRNA processing protein RimM [Filimonas zeae]|uniref:Ribosome maturation factor RimM n=1 Tax=Filimonas zeae TaxID=1737353 RepID=A0A917J367_9BACT|nr:ribosome maturation factor RimM [Filimonas zeae]MDR6341915.1 16S rRNA processing protein RimM [Filimonas zeae]GGH79840.1 ribosome maturation factor RimM [Filimonas zeae]
MDYIHIGKIVATFGVKGELILLHALNRKTALKDVEAVFVEEKNGTRLPYFLETSKAKTGTEIYLKLEGVDTKEAAVALVQKKIWLQDADFRKLAGTKSPISLLGYQLIHSGENLGAIEEVIEQPHQVLLRITYKGNEALIPLHDETLEKVDRVKGEVHVVLPEGLLEIYE